MKCSAHDQSVIKQAPKQDVCQAKYLAIRSTYAENNYDPAISLNCTSRILAAPDSYDSVLAVYGNGTWQTAQLILFHFGCVW